MSVNLENKVTRSKSLDLDIKKGYEYTITITDITDDGFGVGRIGEFVIFVNGVLPGEIVDVKIIKKTNSYAVGKVNNILKISSNRKVPFCSVFGKCGGCTLQHLDYKAQLDIKTNEVIQSLVRIGGFNDVQVHPTIGMKDPLHYRNKAQFPVGLTADGHVAIGFYAPRTHSIVETEGCDIQDTISNDVRRIISKLIKRFNISIYNEQNHRGLIRHIIIRTGFKTSEVMVILVINGTQLPHTKELVNVLISAITNIKSIMLNVNTKKGNVILGNENVCIYGSSTITDYIGKFKFEISPSSFFQVNPVQTEVLYSKVLEYANLTNIETVFDLYCGIGTISLFLSHKAKKVYGVELIKSAIENARRNAKLNSVENVEFSSGMVEHVIPEMYAKGIMADVVVIDPPRKGCNEKLLDTLVNMKPNRIVYVSCKPATLARDLRYLASNGYMPIEVQPVDMFCHTTHVETVVLITKKND